MGWFRRNKKDDSKEEHGKPPRRQKEEKLDIENQNSNMSADGDGSTMSSLSNEQVEDCKEAFSVFVNQEGE